MNTNRNMVVQKYNLVNARYKLNTSETKFVITALTQLNKDDDELKEYSISAKELELRLGVQQNETRLKQLAKKLMSKPLEVPTADGWLITNWFSDIEYIKGEARFLVRFSMKLKPYLLQYKERFVKYNIVNIINLSSEYSIKIYQLLKEYEKATKRTFTVEELQELLQVPKSFLRYDNFKSRVLKVAEKELIENCDIFFEFEEIKTGRKVTEILFRIKKNVKQQEEKQETKLFEDTEMDKYLKTFINKKIYLNGFDWIIKKISINDKTQRYNIFCCEVGDKTYTKTFDISKAQLEASK